MPPIRAWYARVVKLAGYDLQRFSIQQERTGRDSELMNGLLAFAGRAKCNEAKSDTANKARDS